MAKHFNKGVVFGRLAGLERKRSENGKPYIQIYLECPNDLHGDAKVYGRMWGEDRIDGFMAGLNKDGKLMMGTPLRLEGFFSQYDAEDGRRLNNYTFFSWKTYEKDEEYRATFILRGRVQDVYENEDGEGVIHLHLSRPGTNDQTVEEDFILYAENRQDIHGLQEGQEVDIKGLIAEKGEEDYFGETSGIFRPYIKVLKVVEKEAEGVPY